MYSYSLSPHACSSDTVPCVVLAYSPSQNKPTLPPAYKVLYQCKYIRNIKLNELTLPLLAIGKLQACIKINSFHWQS